MANLASYVQTATQEVFKAVTAKYTAPELIARRSLVSSDINDALRKKLLLYGAQVINIDMRNFSFSPEYMAAINSKVTQEQLRLAAENTQNAALAQNHDVLELRRIEVERVKAERWNGALPTSVMQARRSRSSIR